MDSKDKINNNENEHNNLKPSDFQDLTPKDDVYLKEYGEVFNHAFKKYGKEKLEFNDLTPTDDANLTGYKEALDYVFDIDNK